ncbi:MAG: hypothetical protein IJD40_07070 [Lachnospiraceae bacterium]|nr:hypothetical protein [Lachnospiraceae bacterium]
MKTYIIIGILIIFFIYMVVWSVKFYFHTQRQKKVKRIQELRAKGKEEHKLIDDTKDYWYNKREVEACKEGEDVQRYYNFFISVEDAIHGLLIEMYDCGIVRTDELGQISYGKSCLHEVDLSFLEDLDNAVKEAVGNDESAKKLSADGKDEVTDTSKPKEEIVQLDDVIQVEGMTDHFLKKNKQDIVTAAKELKSDDPGITDIRGTLSEGVENIIAAVESEKQEEAQKNEPIIVKEEKSVEQARKAREMTGNAEIRNKVYSKWTGYVEELWDLVVIHASDDTKQKLRKALMDYGYNDVDVLLQSPEYE